MAIILRDYSSILAPAMMLFLMLQLYYMAMPIYSAPTTYLVGDEEGWDLTASLVGWTKGKKFHAGDILEFIYDRQLFSVAVVNKTAYDDCAVNDASIQFDTGDDKIQLAFGANYFIDSEPSVCAAGLKMAINATAPPHHPN